MPDKIARLEDENRKLISECIKLALKDRSAKRDADCLIRIIRNQSNKIDSFKLLFWRIYWK